MTALREQSVSIYVDRSSRRWIIRDPDGRFWSLTSIEPAWDHRQPFTPNDDTDLEAVPGHYKDMLGLPF